MKVMKEVERIEDYLKKIKESILGMSQKVESDASTIKQLEQ